MSEWSDAAALEADRVFWRTPSGPDVLAPMRAALAAADAVRQREAGEKMPTLGQPHRTRGEYQPNPPGTTGYTVVFNPRGWRWR